MRIVQLVESLEVGGMERVAVDLALTHRVAGHHVIVYCLFGAGPLRKELDAAGIPVLEFHKDRHSKLAVVSSMARQLRHDRADIIHGHNPGVHHFAAIAKWMARVPVCVSTRHSAESSTGAPYQERYFRWVEPLTDHVIFSCDYVRHRLEPRIAGYPAAKFSVIRNGIALEKFLPRPAVPGSRRPRVRFGTVGRLVPAKGHAILIEAFSLVAKQLPEAALEIYGYGPLENQLRAQIERLGLEGRVTLAGRTDDAARVFESLDVFVFSSVNEGLPLVVMEAMAAGLPIVSTRIGGVPEVAPENMAGWFAKPGDAPDLANAMLQAVRSPGLAEIGAAVRDFAIAHHSLARMSRDYLEVYSALLKKRRR